jgi:hypothetical protein
VYVFVTWVCLVTKTFLYMFLFIQLLFRGEQASGYIAPIWCTKQHILEIPIDLTQGVVVVTVIVAIYGCCFNIREWSPRSTNAHFCIKYNCPFNQLLFKFWHTYINACIIISVCICCNAFFFFLFNSKLPSQDFLCVNDGHITIFMFNVTLRVRIPNQPS